MKALKIDKSNWEYINKKGYIFVEGSCGAYEEGETLELQYWTSYYSVRTIEMIVKERCYLLNGEEFFVFKLETLKH